jgi:hypothetical protein
MAPKYKEQCPPDQTKNATAFSTWLHANTLGATKSTQYSVATFVVIVTFAMKLSTKVLKLCTDMWDRNPECAKIVLARSRMAPASIYHDSKTVANPAFQLFYYSKLVEYGENDFLYHKKTKKIKDIMCILPIAKESKKWADNLKLAWMQGKLLDKEMAALLTEYEEHKLPNLDKIWPTDKMIEDVKENVYANKQPKGGQRPHDELVTHGVNTTLFPTFRRFKQSISSELAAQKRLADTATVKAQQVAQQRLQVRSGCVFGSVGFGTNVGIFVCRKWRSNGRKTPKQRRKKLKKMRRQELCWKKKKTKRFACLIVSFFDMLKTYN